MSRNHLVALLWTAALIGSTVYFARPYWQPDAFTWEAWSETFWLIVGGVLLGVLLLDTDWKRGLFETHHEKMARKASERNNKSH